MATDAPALYIRTEINFGDGPQELNFSLDGAQITAARVAQCFDDAARAALDKLERGRVARLLRDALGREATADEVALARIGRGPLDKLAKKGEGLDR